MTFIAGRRWPQALICLLAALNAPAQAALWQAELPSIPEQRERPFHSGMVKINPSYKEVKPLATADYAGVSVEDEVLIAAYDDQWTGAFSLRDMRPRWWIAGKGGLTAPPGIFGNWVILAWRDGQVSKVNLMTGAVGWTANLDSFASRTFRKHEGNLLAVTARQTLYSINFETGAIRWIFEGGAPEGISIRTTTAPLVHEQHVYLGLASGEVTAVDLASGNLLWRQNPNFSSARFRDVVGELIVLDRRLMVTRADGVIAAISLDNPKAAVPGWEEPKLLPGITTSTFRQGKLFVGTGNGYVYALDARSGREIWRYQVGASLSSITAGENQIYTASTDGRISTLGPLKGDLIWHDDLNTTLVVPPVYIGKDLYFYSGQRVLYGYRIAQPGALAH